jgi:tetratricopeptide (TPR) repeat protein
MRPSVRRLRSAAIGLSLVAAMAFAIGAYVRSRRQVDPLARASAAYEKGEWSTAAQLARAALDPRHDDPTALKLLARSLARGGRDDLAVAIYTRRLAGTAMEPQDLFLLGLAHDHLGHAEAAAREWQKVVGAARPDPVALEELARVQLQRHRLEEAVRAAELLSRQPGHEARGWMLLGTIKAAIQDVAGAAESFERAIKHDPSALDHSRDPKQLRKLVARTFLRTGLPARARPLLETITGGGPDREAAWLLSRVFLQLGDGARARAAAADAGSYRADNPLEPEPSPYLGEVQCQRCHTAIFRDSLASRHTQSYYRGKDLDRLPIPDHPLPDPDDRSVIQTFRRREGGLTTQTRVGSQVFESVIEYAFGTADRYLTMVSRDAQGAYRIARLSYYHTPHGDGWDRSILERIRPSPARPEEFQGDAIGVRDGLARCLYCHVTNPRAAREELGPETSDRAIGCERCHGPGRNHAAALAAGLTDLAIVNPAAASPAAVTARQCNDCHILDQSFRNTDLSDPGWARSQGVGWTLSRCNTESGGAFGCVTCHDPHKPARARSTAQYEEKCLKCHARAIEANDDSGSTGHDSTQKRAHTCPINPAAGCIACHMPRVKVEALHTDLADHYIRVERKGR